MSRTRQPLTLLQATQESPVLSRLSDLAGESQARLKSIEPLLPASLWGALKPGPIQDDIWCLIASNSAAAAKLRQFLPALCSHLRSHGWQVTTIRIKVHAIQQS